MRADAYSPPTPRGPVDLWLSRNEGRAPRGLAPVALDAERLARYPDLTELRAALARRFDVPPARVLVTAGGDEALLRTCLAVAGPGRIALSTSPTFEMIPRYVQMTGLGSRTVEWPAGPFPTAAFVRASDGVAIAFVVSPNNPTGAVATSEDVRRIARALPDALVVLDAAYGELATEDPTAAALEHDNVVVVRTLSKAWGLAGLRVGYVLGSEASIKRLAAVGNPFPVSAASAAIARERLATGVHDVQDYVARVRAEREQLAETLERFGALPARPIEANFVLARGLDPSWLADAAGALGVAIRTFPERPELADAVRITVPGDAPAHERLVHTLSTALAPEALLFDLDGVLADVSESYRVAIVETARRFGADVDEAAVAAKKARGDANDDWRLTHELLLERGIDVSLEDVTRSFEALYQGSDEQPGLRERERLCVSRSLLLDLGRRFRLAVVTGRPRTDAVRFLERFDVLTPFEEVICREDAALKPDPAPVRLALARLGVERAWFVGDTPDDLAAARGAGALPIGVLPPGGRTDACRAALEAGGAARVLDRTDDLEELLRWRHRR